MGSGEKQTRSRAAERLAAPAIQFAQASSRMFAERHRRAGCGLGLGIFARPNLLCRSDVTKSLNRRSGVMWKVSAALSIASRSSLPQLPPRQRRLLQLHLHCGGLTQRLSLEGGRIGLLRKKIPR